jgi:hypothetical protein
MALEYLTYKDKQVPVKVGYFALKQLQKSTKGKGLAAVGSDLSLYEDLLFYALQRGAKDAGIEFTWKQEDMEDIMEDNFTEFVEIVSAAYADEPGKMKGVGTGTKVSKLTKK